MEDKNEELLFRDDNATLASYGCGQYIAPLYSRYTDMLPPEHETEISFFIMKDYEEFKKNPEEKW
jgi:hypothetical protein